MAETSNRLTIDLDACRGCDECPASCSYPYHGPNNGIARLRELAAYELACRRCEVRSCVSACPVEALQEDQEGVLHRYNMRCTGCLSCSVACPFGTLIPAALEFRDSMCDFCAGRPGQLPLCVSTCPKGAITFAEVSSDDPHVHLLGDNLAVRTVVWQKTEPARAK